MEPLSQEAINKCLLTEPVSKKPLTLTYPTKSLVDPLRDHLSNVCRTTDPLPSKIKWQNLRAFTAVVLVFLTLFH